MEMGLLFQARTEWAETLSFTHRVEQV